jgi:hypothetical protein
MGAGQGGLEHEALGVDGLGSVEDNPTPGSHRVRPAAVYTFSHPRRSHDGALTWRDRSVLELGSCVGDVANGAVKVGTKRKA